MSAEATVIRNYLDWMLLVPWKKRNKIQFDLTKAEKMLDKDHFGLEKDSLEIHIFEVGHYYRILVSIPKHYLHHICRTDCNVNASLYYPYHFIKHLLDVIRNYALCFASFHRGVTIFSIHGHIQKEFS